MKINSLSIKTLFLYQYIIDKIKCLNFILIIMNLKHWCELDELIYISQTDEEYKQYAGLDYNEKMIEQLAEMKIENSNIFIDYFSCPQTSFSWSIRGYCLF